MGDQFVALQPYPNPAISQVTLPIIIPVSSEIRITIKDVLGREVNTILSNLLHSGFNEVTFDAAVLKSGLYFIDYNFQGTVVTHKLIIQ
jgi:hypothetical protein